MSDTNNTTKLEKKQYHHLTKEQRVQIEILLNQKDKNGKRLFSNSYIANAIGVNKSTISRELRNRIKSKINVMSGKIKSTINTSNIWPQMVRLVLTNFL